MLGGYITPAAWGGPQRSRPGERITGGPTSGVGGYLTPAVWGVANTLEQGEELAVDQQMGHVTP